MEPYGGTNAAPIYTEPTEEEIKRTMKNFDTNTIIVPKFNGEDIEMWKLMLFPKLHCHNLVSSVTGSDSFDPSWPQLRKNCYEARKRAAQAILVSALTFPLDKKFNNVAWKADQQMLFAAIESEYTKNLERNTIFLEIDMFNRRLRAYVGDMLRRRAEIAMSLEVISDREFVSVLKSNVIDVYQEITHEYGRNRRNDCDSSVQETIEQLF